MAYKSKHNLICEESDCKKPFIGSSKAHFCPKCHKKRVSAANALRDKGKPRCPGCGKAMRKARESGTCWKCDPNRNKKIGLYKVDFPCPECGTVRKVSKYQINDPRFQPLCGICRPIPRGRATPAEKLDRPSVPKVYRIEINGCALVPAKSGRCEGYTECRHGSHADLYGVPRSQDCCWQTGRQNWGGFTTDGPCHVDLPTLAEGLAIAAARTKTRSLWDDMGL